jgi:hypothetical protein
LKLEGLSVVHLKNKFDILVVIRDGMSMRSMAGLTPIKPVPQRRSTLSVAGSKERQFIINTLLEEMGELDELNTSTRKGTPKYTLGQEICCQKSRKQLRSGVCSWLDAIKPCAAIRQENARS